ncbi:serine/threonine-protein kinase Smg1 [Drosophila albomicans]|uniref:non-specific serine/threonine protein kinase n=1 Tax=Drosophila albomicans TaxID=7291 RepID=A0A6P8XKY4_DROAB|nr:serine/threonine-protein kinase Smg1 [Drosophila albomicans]
MITSRGADSMKRVAIPLDNYNDAEEDAVLSQMCIGRTANNNNNNNKNSSRNCNHGYGNSTATAATTTTTQSLWSKAHDMQHQQSASTAAATATAAASSNGNPALRNLNNDMTKGIQRRSHQCKMQFTASDRDAKLPNDDMRMSKIMRRLHNETSPAAALELCAKLDMVVRTPLNMGYLTRSFDAILDGMLSVLKQCPAPVLEECSKTLGLIGFINRMAYPSYEEFIVKNYRAHKRLQKYLIVALRTTLSCDTKCDLHIYAEQIMLMLKDFLEGAESVDSFMAVSSCIVEFSHIYRDVFERHFTDVVDIIIGWQLELGQPKHLKSHCAHVLEQLTPYFSKQLDFSYGLLTQFIEDITTLEASERTGERIGAFVRSFNSLLKCLTRMHITCEAVVLDAQSHLMQLLPEVLEAKESQSDALLNMNEFFCICLLNGYATGDVSALTQVIRLEFEHVQQLPQPEQLSCLYLLLCAVRKLRARLPAELVQLIFQSHCEFFASIRLQSSGAAHNLLLRTCQETLLIRNVPLLQQAYKQLVHDIDNCVRQLANDNEEKEKEKVEEEDSQQREHVIEQAGRLLIFHLSALAALAKQTSSIIGMYACKPSILELLISNCRAAELQLWSQHAATHHALLGLLVVHCQANHNFRNNSSLLREQENNNSESPTAHSFGHILKFLAQTLMQAAALSLLNLQLLLNWTKSLLHECSGRCSLLLQHADFRGICECIAVMAAKCAPLESAACMQVVLGYGSDQLSPRLLQLYRETALQQLQSLCPQAHAAFAQIYAQLPLSLSIARRPTLGIGCSPVCVWQQRLTVCSAVRDNVFRDFVAQLQAPQHQLFAETLRGLFTRSWQVTALDERQEKLSLCTREKLSQCTRRCQRLTAAWLQYEAARYCVDQKLRTTLGKPQDTFLAFEAIVMRYARLLSGCAKEAERLAQDELSLEQLSNTRANLNMLLGFLDALEKLIYNAAEGSAFALRQPEKPVSAFFRLNNPTCQSWFNRIRIGVVIIAMHSQQPELVIRYAQQILQTQKAQDCSYSQAIVYLAWAFLRCREADSLRGLNIWARAKSDKCYQWLQHAAEQAAGRKEAAIAGYRSVLAVEELHAELEPHTRQFVQAQLIECLQSTGQWTALLELRSQLKRSEEQLNPFLQKSSVQMSSLEQLLAKSTASSDELNAALHKLSLWSDANAQTEHASFSACYVHEKLENLLLQQAMLQTQFTTPMQQLLDMNWREALLNSSCDQQQWQQLTLLKHIAQQLRSVQSEQSQLCLLPRSLNRESKDSSKDCGMIRSSLLVRCVAWTQLLRRHCSLESLGELYLDTASLAREEGNQQTCQAMLELYFGQPLKQMARQLIEQRHELDTTTSGVQLLRGYSELTKCLHLQQQHQLQCSELSSINVCAALCLAIQKQPTSGSIGAELLLTLSDWITARSCSGLATNLSPTLQQLLEQLPECPLTGSSSQQTQQPMSLPHGERLVARLLNASLQQQPDSEEALIAYGNWCYRWGKKIVDSGSVLTQSDIQAIGEALGGKMPAMDGEQLQELLQALRLEHQQEVASDVELPPLADAQCEQRLRRLSLLADKPASVLEAIMRIWRRAIANTFDYYKQAARAYFHYLSLKAGDEQQQQLANGQRFHVDDSNMVTTTLRLLRLIVKHASGLQDVLEQGLKTTPIGPWKVIIPQLFSRLNHHEPYVRKSVCALLCRLAESCPQLVTFPAVVGANRELQAKPLNADAPMATEITSIMADNSSCCACLLGALSKQAPEVVQHVQLLVRELRRVCLLWDEYWIHSLAHIYNTYVGRVTALASEFKPDDHEGKQNRFNSWRPQLLNDLEALMAFTARDAETSYERSFKRRFDAPIAATLEALRHRPYPEAWDKLKQLYHVLQLNMLRGTSNMLKMQTISPVLCDIGRMRISMPGLDAHDEQQPVYIESVESTICILPTKTKPKKVAFYGNNGQKYTFLFKGLEDLHLDERIMQFLSISNAIMASKNDTPNSCYRAHHYSVIPLGPQSGLISWVDGMTPLFALYKKWQQRQPQTATAASSRRLTDLFYNKLSPLLAKHNMLVTDPRRQWPLSALRQVLAELMQETPADLLARELWCQAGSSAEWRQSVRRYTTCMAVMSVIGYVIGLGDRHLDNVLINLNSGDLVHIDYNVCFEKGRTLRIPERVPFRLTQNMVNALGITGVEGAFRLGCEYVLKVMRKERETLLTLLEAFVYDPLVDWTVNDEANAMRRAINAKPCASVSTSAVGGNEMKCLKKDKSKNKLHDWDAKRRHFVGKLKQCQKFWSKYKPEMLEHHAVIVDEIEQLQQSQSHRLATEQELVQLNRRSALIAEIKALGSAMSSHSFNTASTRYACKRCHTETLAKQATLRQPDYEMVQQILQHYEQCLQQQQLGEFNVRLIQYKLEGSSRHSEYLTLLDVVQLHLPAKILSGYDAVRNQLDEQFRRHNNLGLQCVEHMLQYAAIMAYYPEQRHRDNVYVRFHDTYAGYLQHADINGLLSSSGCSGISATNTLNAAETLENVWMELNCQLHQLTQHYANEQAVAQTQTPSHTLIAALGQSNCSASLLSAALIRTLEGATAVFNEYEQTALATHGIGIGIGSNSNNLVQQQLQFVQLVRSMCRVVVGAEPPGLEQANDQLSDLEAALSAVVQLQHCFEHDLPTSIFRLLLLNSNMDHLQTLLHLNAESLAERYNQQIVQEQQPTTTLSVEQQFLLSLRSAHACFQQLARALERITRTIKLIVDELQEEQTQQCMELNILKNGSTLCESLFFDLVLHTLRVSKCYDVRVMARPVLGFVQRLETEFLVGLVSPIAYAYYTSCTAGSGGARCQDLCDNEDVSQLCDGIFAALQAEATLRQQQIDIAFLNQKIETQTLIASAYHWAYGELLDAEMNCSHIISRQKLCEAIYENWQTLEQSSALMHLLQCQLQSQLDQLQQQRSNWNRNHIDSLLRNQKLQHQLTNDQLQLISELGKCASALCTMEQTGKLTKEQQKQMLHNMEQWLQANSKWQVSNARISAVEQAIVQLLDPEGPIDKCWLANVQGLLEDYTCKVQRDMQELECEQQTRHRFICASLKDMQRHQDNMPRVYLRSLCSEDDQLMQPQQQQQQQAAGKLVPLDVQLLSGHVRDAQRTLMNFFQRLLELRKELSSERRGVLNAETLGKWRTQLQEIQTMANDEVDEFFRSVEVFLQHSADGDSLPYETFAHNKGAPNLHEQKRNAYGVSVWKKIRMKLEGRDPDSNQRCTVTEQVDYVIREATNPDNLAVLYEGWTPWV